LRDSKKAQKLFFPSTPVIESRRMEEMLNILLQKLEDSFELTFSKSAFDNPEDGTSASVLSTAVG
jgi:hypothetical protein